MPVLGQASSIKQGSISLHSELIELDHHAKTVTAIYLMAVAGSQ
jgi:hypothetical protein